MGDIFKGDYKPPQINQSTGDQLSALVKYLPQLAQAYSQQILPTGQAELAAQQQLAPAQQALNTQLYGTYGPQIADISNRIAAQTTQADTSNLANNGQQLAQAGLNAQRIADPEYYATRALTGQKTNDLLNSIDINGLSGSERAETERYLNQQAQQGGSPDVTSGIKTIENAGQFGNALQNKRNALGQAIGQATNFLPTAKSGVDVFQQVTGRPSINNPNAAAPTSAQPVGAAANNLTSQLFGQIGDTQARQQNLEAARRPVSDHVNSAYSASGLGTCCFIFMEIYNGILPDNVRICRDYYYAKEPKIAKGYRIMASYLVPLMRRSRLIRWAVNTWMVKPLTIQGDFVFGKSIVHRRKTKSFWFGVWKFIGEMEN